MRIGIVGTGKICDIYLKNIKERFTSNEVTAVADLLEDRARDKATEYDVPHALPERSSSSQA